MTTSRTITLGILEAIGAIFLIAVLGYVLFELQTVLLYLIISLILTLIGSKIKIILKDRFKFNNLPATIATMSFFILCILCFIMMFVPLVISQIESLSLLKTSEIEKNTKAVFSHLKLFLNSRGLDAEQILNQSDLYSGIDFKAIPNFINIIISAISDFGIGLVSVLFITFFLLKDKNHFIISFRSLLPLTYKRKILISLRKTNDLLARYFIGLLIQLTVVFVLYLIILLIFGVNNAATIAFLCALLNIIPYIGPLVGTALAAILTMIGHLGTDFQTENLPTVLYVVIGFSLVQFIDNNISSPLIFSKSTESHPLEIFLVILIAGYLFGILGMIVAIPVYTILKVAGKEFFPENKIIKLLTHNL